MFLWLLFASCTHPCAPDELVTNEGVCVSQDDGSDADDTDDDSAMVLLTGPCEAPDGLAADPLELTGQVRLVQTEPGGGHLVELIDVHLDGDRGYGVGQGGLEVYDITDSNDPRYLYSYPQAPNFARYHRALVLAPGIVAMANRDEGLVIADVRGDSEGDLLFSKPSYGMEALAWDSDEGVLLVGMRGQGVLVVELDDDWSGTEVGLVAGPTATWAYSNPAGGWIYAADAIEGVVPIDVSNPRAPAAATGVLVGGDVRHIAQSQGVIYAAIGAGGVAVLEASDPSAPVLVTTVETGSSAVQVAVGDGLLWAVDHDGVAVFDLSDPLAPALLHRETTEQFALAVAARGEQAWVGDWNLFSGFHADPTKRAPKLDLPASRLYADPTSTTTVFTVTNRGSDDLVLTGASVQGAELTVQVDRATIPPGEQAELTLTGPGGALDATVCIASNDPDDPVQEFLLQTTDGETLLGQDAPDFCLVDTEGVEHCLSDHAGRPVVLAYFATW